MRQAGEISSLILLEPFGFGCCFNYWNFCARVLRLLCACFGWGWRFAFVSAGGISSSATCKRAAATWPRPPRCAWNVKARQSGMIRRWRIGAKNAYLLQWPLIHLAKKPISLPRQARGKHWARHSKREMRLSQEYGGDGRGREGKQMRPAVPHRE